MESDPNLAARSIVRTTLVVLVIFGFLIGAFQTQPVAAASFSARDVSVDSRSGRLDSLTVAPTGTVTYEGLDQPPVATTVAVQLRIGGSWETIGSQSIVVDDLQGSIDYSFAPIDVLDQTSKSLIAKDFSAKAPQKPAITTLNIRIQVTFAGVFRTGGDLVTTTGDTFDVVVSKTGGPPGGGPPGGGPPV
jgi:hypothetical protein